MYNMCVSSFRHGKNEVQRSYTKVKIKNRLIRPYTCWGKGKLLVGSSYISGFFQPYTLNLLNHLRNCESHKECMGIP